MSLSPTRSTRLNRAARNRLLMQALEQRTLMSTVFVHDSGNITTNGTNLQNALNAATYGETIVLDANVVYLAYSFTLPDITTGTGTITIESSAIYNGTALPAGVRVGPGDAANMPKLESEGGNAPVIKTKIVGTTATHDFTLLGLECLPENDTVAVSDLVDFGFGDSTQSLTSQVASNFILDRCYIHGLDNLNTDYKSGVSLNSYNSTVENCYISDIHYRGNDAQAIVGFNGTGNYTITNNYLEATGENILFGGSDTFIANNTPTNITVTNNYVTKRESWNDNDPSFLGIHMTVKNIFELKNAKNVIVTDNIFENCWVGKDQKAFCFALSPRNQDGGNTWAVVANVTISNNVIRHCGAGANFLGSDDDGPVSQQMHDITLTNNLFYDIGGAYFGYKGQPEDGIAFQFIAGPNDTPTANVTIDHNVMMETHNIMTLDSGHVEHEAAVTNLTFTNNIILHAKYGVLGTGDSEGSTSLNEYAPGALFTKNIIVGYTGSTSAYPAGNFYPATPDAAGFVDTSGDWWKLLSTSVGHGTATDGTDIGVNLANLDPEFVPIDSTLQNFYKFDEGTGTTANDNGGGTHHNGTLSSSTLWTTAGEANGGLALTGGTSGSVSVASFSTDSSFTYSTWIKPTSVSATQYIASTANNAFSLSVNSSGKLVATGTTGSVTDATALTAGNWYYVTLTFSSGTLTLYKNGASVASGAGTTTAGSTTLTIGGNNGSVSSFNGTIDEVAYYSSALSSSNAALVYSQHAPQMQYQYDSTVSGSTDVMSIYALSHADTQNTTETYNWAIVSQPAGVSAPTFSNNHTNNRFTTVTFYGDGTYTFSMSVTDPFGVSSPAFVTGTMTVTGSGGGATVYDGFNYTSGTGANLNGQNTGLGFSGTWSVSNTSLVNVLSGSLNYSNGGHTLLTAANSVNLTNQASASQTMTNSIGTIGTSTWVGFELNEGHVSGSATMNGELRLNSNWLLLGSPLGGAISGLVTNGSSNWYLNSSTTVANNTTYFCVYRIDYLSTGDVISMYINPTPNVTPTTASGTLTLPATVTLPVSTAISLKSNNDATVVSSFDEIRIGTTYASVAPENVTPIPAAPTNLAAFPQTSSVKLTWTDNATNETGFHVYRSTDNATWGTAIASPVADSTSYTDTTASAGVAYYYEVTAYNGSGESSAAGMTCAVATVIASDSFNYVVGAWTGGNTGVGLSTNWSISNTTKANVLSGSLTYSSGTHALTTFANSVQLNNYGAATGTMTSSIGAIGTTTWIGFEFNAYHTNTSESTDAQISLNPSAGAGTGIQFGASLAGEIDARFTVGTYDSFLNTTTTAANNTTYFVVASIQYLSTGDVVNLYINPTPGVTPTTPTGTKTFAATATLPVSSQIILYSQASTYATFDELRIGTTYASVAPDPLLTAPTPAAAHASLPTGVGPLTDRPALHASPLLVTIDTPTLESVPVSSIDTSWHATGSVTPNVDPDAQDPASDLLQDLNYFA